MGGKSNDPTGTIDTTGQSRQRSSSSGTSQSATEVTIPSFLQPFLQQGTNTASGALAALTGLSGGDMAADFTQDQTAAFDMARGFGTSDPFTSGLNALMSTANGDFLFGGDGFNAGVDAAVRAAQPHILSTFGAAGGEPGGLAQTAIAQVATDAFARQFGAERGRQMQAASALPGMGMLPIDLLLRTGGQQQAQAQREIDAPLAAQQNLFASALGGLPIASLLGSTSTGSQSQRGTSRGTTMQQQPYFENQDASGLGLALSGLGLASGIGGALFGPQALAGGLLGLLR